MTSRDIQQFEYVPLGPFLGKNFGTTVSPWIVTLDALEAARVPAPTQDPIPSTYLVDPNAQKDAYDVDLEVYLKPQNGQASLISKSNLKYMYWTFKQQLAHHTVNGCNMRSGDLCASGTLSGPTQDSLGSLLELSLNGANPIAVGDAKRAFIEDGDELIIKGKALGGKIGFGQCAGVVLPSL
jgi:fumarylacetoacetase